MEKLESDGAKGEGMQLSEGRRVTWKQLRVEAERVLGRESPALGLVPNTVKLLELHGLSGGEARKHVLDLLKPMASALPSTDGCEHDWGTQDFTDLGVPEEEHVWDCWKCGATRTFAELFGAQEPTP